MIRKVCIHDAAEIATIYNEYIEKTTVTFETEPLTIRQMESRIEDISGKYPFFVCTNKNEIVGYAYAHRWRERNAYCGTLETTVYLDAAARHKGIGRALMKQVIDECKMRGFRVLIACITAENTDSIEFHKKLGFVQASYFHNVGQKFNRLLNIVDMELQLQYNTDD